MDHEKKIAELLGIIEKNPELLAKRNEARSETLKQRKQAADTLERIEKSWETEAKRLDKAIADRLAKITDALKRVEGLRLDYSTASLERMRAGYQYDTDSLEQKKILMASCDGAIDEAIEFFREKMEWLRRTDRFQTADELDAATNHFGEFSADKIFSSKRRVTNVAAVQEAVTYCRDAVRELEDMRLLPECDHARIEELRRGIPSIDRFTPAMEFPKKSPITGQLENVA